MTSRRESIFTYKKGGKGGTGHDGEYVPGRRYRITVENLTTRWERDRAKAAAELSRWPISAGMTCVTPLQAQCRAPRDRSNGFRKPWAMRRRR